MAEIIITIPEFSITIPDNPAMQQTMRDFMDRQDPANAGSNYVNRFRLHVKQHGVTDTREAFRLFDRNAAAEAAGAAASAKADGDYMTES